MEGNISQALTVIEERPQRRSRAETIMRMLTTTSYPHATLANLVIALARCVGEYEQPRLEQLALDLRKQEKQFEFMDFIRVIDIRRIGNVIKITAKRAKALRVKDTFADDPAQHEVFYQQTIDFETGGTEVVDVAHLLMMSHYRTQVLGPKKDAIAAGYTWKIKTKLLVADGPQLRDLRKQSHESKVTPTDVIRRLVTSLQNTDMSISLGPKAIIIRDQSTRCWISHS